MELKTYIMPIAMADWEEEVKTYTVPITEITDKIALPDAILVELYITICTNNKVLHAEYSLIINPNLFSIIYRIQNEHHGPRIMTIFNRYAKDNNIPIRL